MNGFWLFSEILAKKVFRRVATMRPVFVGNFGFDTRQTDLERLFGKYGKIERVDMKSGNPSFTL
jgi:RNA recognition motif-containing protein